MAFLKGWKTLAFATISGLVLILKGWTSGDVAAEAPSAETVQTAIDTFEVVMGLIVLIGGWAFRAVTNSPIFKKDPPAPPPVE